MKIKYQKKFLKQLAKLPLDIRTQIEQFVFVRIPEASTIGLVGKIEKLSGYKDYYKVRFGKYRVGIKIENNTIILKTVLHRKEIYRYFP